MNETEISGSIAEHFSKLQNPRFERTRLHKLSEILVRAIWAVTLWGVVDEWENRQKQSGDRMMILAKPGDHWKII